MQEREMWVRTAVWNHEILDEPKHMEYLQQEAYRHARRRAGRAGGYLKPGGIGEPERLEVPEEILPPDRPGGEPTVVPAHVALVWRPVALVP